MIKFFIAGIRRTGTGLIRTTLDNHPQIRCIGEAFNFGGRFSRQRGSSCDGGYRQYISKTPVGQFRDLLARNQMTEKYLDQFYQNSTMDAVGFKLMLKQHRRFPAVLEYMRRNDARVIHVVRENVLKTLVSRTVKRATGQSHTTKEVGKTPIVLREDSLLRNLERLDQENKMWPELCKGMPYIQVTYEDFVANRSKETTAILKFLDMEPIADLESHFVKGNPDDLREIILNYDAVADILSGTRFENFLKK